MSAWYETDTPDAKPSPEPQVKMEQYEDYGIIRYGQQGPTVSVTEPTDYADVELFSEEFSADSYWNPYLYQLQLEAPKPCIVRCSVKLPDRPSYYGEEYHGCVSHDEVSHLLKEDGDYLVRAGLRNPGTYSLSFFYDGRVRHFRLYYDKEGHHYTGEKKFDSVEDLVADGLITLHMEKNNVMSYIEESRETAKKTTTPTTPTAVVPLSIPSVRTPVRRHTVNSSSSSAPVMRREIPGRGSRTGNVLTSPASKVLSVHGEQNSHQLDSVPSKAIDDSVLTSPKRTNSLRLFKQRSTEKKTRPPNLSNSSTASDLRSLEGSSSSLDQGSGFEKRSSSFRFGSKIKTPSFEEKQPPSPPKAPNAEHHLAVEEPSSGAPLHSSSTPNLRPTSNGDYSYVKPHNFKIRSWMGPAWCDLCRNFMWGLRSQGYQCADCGLIAHQLCKNSASFDCIPSQNKFRKLFGVDLTIIVKLYNTKTPVVLKHCISEVERRGLNIEGLYRVAGQTEEIMKIKEEFDKGQLPDLGIYQDVHAITGVLKLYLRELPIPLIAYDVYNLALIAVRCGAESERKDKLRIALKRLSKPHYNSLKFLIEHLNQIKLFSYINKMTARNIAVVFAPTLIRSPNTSDNFTDMKRLPEHREIVELLILNKKYFF